MQHNTVNSQSTGVPSTTGPPTANALAPIAPTAATPKCAPSIVPQGSVTAWPNARSTRGEAGEMYGEWIVSSGWCPRKVRCRSARGSGVSTR